MAKKILMVDDQIDCLDATGFMLKKKGFEFIGVQNYAEFTKILAKEMDSIWLIVMDLDMPDVNGIELYKLFGWKLRDANIPILVYTAAYDDETKYPLLDQLSLAAPLRCVPKSSPDELVDAVKLQMAFKADLEQTKAELAEQQSRQIQVDEFRLGELTPEEQKEKQELDNKLRYRELDYTRVHEDPEWLRLLELGSKEMGDGFSASRYRVMIKDYFVRSGNK
ncbi:MAG: response regulator [Pseudomonadota bacterium]